MNPKDNTRSLTIETAALRAELATFLDSPWSPEGKAGAQKIGDFKFGVYAFFDFDREPIYVGQTNEKVRTRIRRHLTNQRTDAVAMNVLDPFEVFEVEVWPLPQFETFDTKNAEAKKHLDALEAKVFENAVKDSKFGAVLNEKPPPTPKVAVTIPPSFRRQNCF